MKKSIFFLLLFVQEQISYSQDLHFSQWFNSPLSTNPANTGFIPQADYRVGANYRNQWNSILSTPYKTMSIWGDAQVLRNKFENGWLGVGGLILRDVAGTGNLTSTKIYASLAYHQQIGLGSLLSVGFNAGWANKRIDPTKLKFPDQFNTESGFFDAAIPSSAAFTSTNINYVDLQVGVNYAYFPNSNTYINGGVSIHHINRPKETFFEKTSGYDNRIAQRYIGFVNSSFKLNDRVIINPMAYYTNQSKASELVGGLNANYNLSGDGELQVSGGLYYRLKDAFIPMIGFQWKIFRMTFTYDITTSSLNQYNKSRGAFEFSLVNDAFYKQNDKEIRQSICPKF